MRKDDPNIKKFIEHVKKDCSNRGIRLTISPKKYVVTGTTKCNGFFDSTRKELAVAAGLPLSKWFITLVHEYCHMTQWIEDCPEWKDVHAIGNFSYEDLLGLWIEGAIELTKEQVEKGVMPAIAVERDCEIRALKMIKKFNLPVDPKEYSRNANAYLIFWANIRYFRKWYEIGREPYRKKGILKVVPDIIKPLSYYKYPRFLELYDKECFK